MKQVVLLFFIAISTFCNAQIPNASFENWQLVGSDTVIDGDWEGKDITLLNKVFIYTPQGTESRSAYAGNNFIEIKHEDSAQTGTLKLGYLHSKFSFTQRPKSFSFSGIYLPQINGEDFAIIIILTKGNDTIGNTVSRFGGITVTNWSKLSINLKYDTSFSVAPDSCYIRLQLLPTQSNTASKSTKLFVDNLQFSNFPLSSTVLIENHNSLKNLKVYPNPASTSTTLSLKSTKETAATISIVDIGGKVVFTSNQKINKGNNQIPINIINLKAGFYTCIVKTETEKKLSKLIVAH